MRTPEAPSVIGEGSPLSLVGLPPRSIEGEDITTAAAGKAITEGLELRRYGNMERER